MALTVVVSPNDCDIEWVSDVLWGLGVVAIEEIVDAAGIVRLRTSLGENRVDAEDALTELPEGVTWEFEEVDDRLVDAWRDHVEAFDVGERFTVIPAWRTLDGLGVATGRTKLVIEPGSTFGMGDHPTTRGCLCMMEKIPLADVSVLDVGCGSGILGIAALKMGSSTAHGIDINPASVRVSMENARANGVEANWSVSTESLSSVDDVFDVVVANILAPVLIDLSAEISRTVVDGGRLILSGVLDGRYDHVLSHFVEFELIERVVIDGWATLCLKRHD